MEKEELKNYIKTRFEEIGNLESQKAILIDEAKDKILEVLKGSLPALAEADKEIKYRVNEIKSTALELKETYSCDSGRVIYFEPWLDEKEGVRIQGARNNEGPCLFSDCSDVIGIIVTEFIKSTISEEANESGGGQP